MDLIWAENSFKTNGNECQHGDMGKLWTYQTFMAKSSYMYIRIEMTSLFSFTGSYVAAYFFDLILNAQVWQQVGVLTPICNMTLVAGPYRGIDL
jgi:hypothetical protein